MDNEFSILRWALVQKEKKIIIKMINSNLFDKDNGILQLAMFDQEFYIGNASKQTVLHLSNKFKSSKIYEALISKMTRTKVF